MMQVVKRLKAFQKRRGRFKLLRKAGVRTDRVVRTGGVSGITFGQRSLGVSDSILVSKGELLLLPVVCPLGVPILTCPLP
jgi:hypothetical protein